MPALTCDGGKVNIHGAVDRSNLEMASKLLSVMSETTRELTAGMQDVCLLEGMLGQTGKEMLTCLAVSGIVLLPMPLESGGYCRKPRVSLLLV